MSRFAQHLAVLYFLLLPYFPASAQDVELKGKVQLMTSGRQVKDASKLVVWLTPVGNTPPVAAPLQKNSKIPQLIQRD